MRRFAISVCAAALLITGCGGGGDDQAELPDADQNQIQLVTDQLIAAAGQKDGDRICGIFQPSLVNDAFGSKKKCAKRIVKSLRSSDFLESLEIASFKKDGSGAKVTFKQNPPGEVAFVKENGAWYIDLTSLAGGS